MSKPQIRVCDYIASRLYTLGVRHVYGITGGGAAGLNDGIAKHGQIQWIANHHEQASSFAAMGEAKLTGRLAVVNPTTGCGGTNCMTGVLDAWQDSVPILFISGNVNRAQMTVYANHAGRHVRKHGVQEADIIALVAPITKYAQTVDSPEEIVHKLEAAIWFATHGRKGPVWLDIPTDVQTALITPPETVPVFTWGDKDEVEQFKSVLGALPEIEAMLHAAKRPLLLLGAGARDAREEVGLLSRRFAIPFVTTFGAVDLLPDHPYYIGRIGIKGDRAGNFALYTCDLLIVLGSSLNTPATGYNLDHFAPHAKVVQVDIDARENQCADLADVYVRATVEAFISSLLCGLLDVSLPYAWNDLCRKWRNQWPVCLPEYEQEREGVNLYTFTDALNRALPENAAVVSDAGSALYVPCQTLKLKEGQRHIVSLAQADMGWSLPASIGVALQGVPTVVVTGDGSFQTNIQELATIRALNLPVKIFVWNNRGYLSIRATQRKMFEGRLMGTDEGHGLWFPPLQSLAVTYGFHYDWVDSTADLSHLPTILSCQGPVLIEVICPPDQPIVPTIRAARNKDGVIEGRPLCDMSPALPREEIECELIAALAIT